MTTRNRELATIIDDSGNITATGNLTVSGNLAQQSSTTTTYADNLLELNTGASSNSNDLGFVFERGSTGDNAILIWDESNDGFLVGTTTATGSATGNITVTAGDFAAGKITVDNVLINGTTIGHTSDTDLLTLADGLLTVAGEISVTTLDIGGTNVTATAAELNILDGVNSTAAELNILDGVTATAAEINFLDGDTSATGTTLAAADRVIVNDGGTMKQVALSDFETFFESEIDTFSTIDINGGSIDGATVGAASASTGAFTTLTASGAITGTLGTAAQTNITSLGTLSSLAVSGNQTIGGTLAVTGVVTANAGVQIDALNLDGRTIASTDTNGNINISPHGTGTTVIAGNTTVGGTLGVTGVTTLSAALNTTGNITIDSAGSAGLTLDRASTSTGSTIDFKTAGTLKWYMGLRGLTNDNWYLRDEVGSTNALTVTSGGNLTVAGTLGVTGALTASTVTTGNSNLGSNSSHLANLTINNNGHIGTTYNSTAIQIATAGNVTFNTDADSQFTIGNGGTNAVTLYGGSGDELYMGANATYRLRFPTSGDVVMDNGGSFGIGIGSPSAPLHVKAGTGMTGGWGRSVLLSHNFPFLVFESEYSTSAFAGIGYDNTTGLKFWVNSSSVDVTGSSGAALAMTILDNHNVGIGTAAPTSLLDIKGTAAASDVAALRIENESNQGGSTASINFMHQGQNAGMIRAGKKGSYGGSTVRTGDLRFSVSSSGAGALYEVMRMYAEDDNKTGHVGIGVTDPDGNLVVASENRNKGSTNTSNTTADEHPTFILEGTRGSRVAEWIHGSDFAPSPTQNHVYHWYKFFLPGGYSDAGTPGFLEVTSHITGKHASGAQVQQFKILFPNNGSSNTAHGGMDQAWVDKVYDVVRGGSYTTDLATTFYYLDTGAGSSGATLFIKAVSRAREPHYTLHAKYIGGTGDNQGYLQKMSFLGSAADNNHEPSNITLLSIN